MTALGFSESNLKVLFIVEEMKAVLLGMLRDVGLSIESHFQVVTLGEVSYPLQISTSYLL